jgi:hypothetical protein
MRIPIPSLTWVMVIVTPSSPEQVGGATRGNRHSPRPIQLNMPYPRESQTPGDVSRC